MKSFPKIAAFLVLAGLVLLVLITLTPLGPKMRHAVHFLPGQAMAAAATVMQPSAPDLRPNEAPRNTPPKVAAAEPINIKIPAIRGENNYGWVQLPHGTPVDFLRNAPGGLIVRWDDTVVQIPPTAALSGAIALRTPTTSNFRN